MRQLHAGFAIVSFEKVLYNKYHNQMCNLQGHAYKDYLQNIRLKSFPTDGAELRVTEILSKLSFNNHQRLQTLNCLRTVKRIKQVESKTES